MFLIMFNNEHVFLIMNKFSSFYINIYQSNNLLIINNYKIVKAFI